MCKGILGKKLGMSGVFATDGRYVPVTVVEAGPCIVTQIKTKETDGYNALQLGFGEKKPKNVNKPRQGHFKKSGDLCYSFVREFSVDNPGDYTLGQAVTAELFKIGDRVDVSGKTKGRGFSGTIKRHGFHRGRMTHGGHCIRIPGSIGCCAWPAKVVKGKKMPGQYGNARRTIKKLEIVDIRPEENLIMLKGAVPGPRSGVVEIQKLKMIKEKQAG